MYMYMYVWLLSVCVCICDAARFWGFECFRKNFVFVFLCAFRFLRYVFLSAPRIDIGIVCHQSLQPASPPAPSQSTPSQYLSACIAQTCAWILFNSSSIVCRQHTLRIECKCVLSCCFFVFKRTPSHIQGALPYLKTIC